jgi:hypothetical protein
MDKHICRYKHEKGWIDTFAGTNMERGEVVFHTKAEHM